MQQTKLPTGEQPAFYCERCQKPTQIIPMGHVFHCRECGTAAIRILEIDFLQLLDQQKAQRKERD